MNKRYNVVLLYFCLILSQAYFAFGQETPLIQNSSTEVSINFHEPETIAWQESFRDIQNDIFQTGSCTTAKRADAEKAILLCSIMKYLKILHKDDIKMCDLESYTVTPLAWALVQSDAEGFPDILEECICLTRNEATGVTSLWFLVRNLREYPVKWKTGSIYNEKNSVGIYFLDAKGSFNEQWVDCLRRADFGPNHYSNQKCISMKFFLTKKERETFVFPYIDREEKARRFWKGVNVTPTWDGLHCR